MTGTGGGSDIAVVLHGLGQSRWNMLGVSRALRRAGFDARPFGYPSLRRDIGSLAALLDAHLRETGAAECGPTIHFVTHSMGGLVVRDYLAGPGRAALADRLGRVVMIAPPLGGSEVADLLHGLRPYRWFYGPAGQELTTAAQRHRAERVTYPLGVIAGDAGWLYPVARFLFTGAHDGRVAVARTRSEGLADHIVLPATHSLLPWRRDVQRQVVSFLRDGRFRR